MPRNTYFLLINVSPPFSIIWARPAFEFRPGLSIYTCVSSTSRFTVRARFELYKHPTRIIEAESRSIRYLCESIFLQLDEFERENPERARQTYTYARGELSLLRV